MPTRPHLRYHTRLLRALLLFPQMKETIMNQEKLAKLQAQVRIGGKVGAASLAAIGIACPCPHKGAQGCWKRVWGAALSALSFTRLSSRVAALLQGPLKLIL